MDARQTGGFLALAAVLTAAGCIISQDEQAGRECAFDADCPESYTCAGPEGQRFCEVIYPPRPGTPDGGSTDGGPTDGGTVVPTYCAEIQPILAANCVSTCHGALTEGSNRSDFRLDYYESADTSQPKGAKAMATRIKVRAFDFQTMPPSDPKPSDAERALLARWAVGGAPFCSDGGTPDAGGN
ncbi:hypothetical protein [Hyalangium rubrum]|uniref:Lipoprotein n=1 Tax=Hyalangium rubrum TaxID=3103134 RepID=A0ABU5HBQ5_9BACT|nr:hypothetical protein [Hyalangium sp. s54d21]MDY7230715.1 hypothetical protein [Hyalangium sp. s54d21]